MEEVWKPVVGYEGYYEVSNKGNVRSTDRTVVYKNGKTHFCKGVILAPSIIGGYRLVSLTINHSPKYLKVARLVGFAFQDICGVYFEGAYINHKSEVKTDDRAENLEWVTPQENTVYGTSIERRSKARKRRVMATNPDTDEKYYFDGAVDAVIAGYAKRTSGISTAIKKGTKHNGYYWDFA